MRHTVSPPDSPPLAPALCQPELFFTSHPRVPHSLNTLLFLAYLFVAIFIMLSVFLAILAEAQIRVRADEADKLDDPEFREFGVISHTFEGCEDAARRALQAWRLKMKKNVPPPRSVRTPTRPPPGLPSQRPLPPQAEPWEAATTSIGGEGESGVATCTPSDISPLDSPLSSAHAAPATVPLAIAMKGPVSAPTPAPAAASATVHASTKESRCGFRPISDAFMGVESPSSISPSRGLERHGRQQAARALSPVNREGASSPLLSRALRAAFPFSWPDGASAKKPTRSQEERLGSGDQEIILNAVLRDLLSSQAALRNDLRQQREEVKALRQALVSSTSAKASSPKPTPMRRGHRMDLDA